MYIKEKWKYAPNKFTWKSWAQKDMVLFRLCMKVN